MWLDNASDIDILFYLVLTSLDSVKIRKKFWKELDELNLVKWWLL